MSDVILQVKIPDAVVSTALTYFLEAIPMPQIPDPEVTPAPEEEPVTIDEYTNKRWVELEIIAHLHRICGIGKKKIEAQPADINLFEEV